MSESVLPEHIHTETELHDVMTRPTPALIDVIASLSGPLLILGAGGKMGPTLAVLARRAVAAAGQGPDVVAVSRYSNLRVREWLERQGVRTIAADLMDPGALARLPDTDALIYMVGSKFGTTGHPERTWAINALLPARVAARFPRARIAALSTGNVYPMAPVVGPGSAETDPLTPRGEYANSCVGRERLLGFYSRKAGTPVVLIRLSYALDLRYGVVVDVARKVYAGLPVDVTMGYANGIWQGDANAMILRSLALAASPAYALNLTGPRFSIREVAMRLGKLMDRPITLVGREAETAYLSDTTRLHQTLGHPSTPLDAVIRWTAQWIVEGGPLLDKPTHFETRNGRY
jgi:nucleoside-diphosphate-sugar epimerase